MPASNMQDDFVTRLQQRDHAVIEDIYDAYGSTLFGFILNIVRSRDLAEHVLQDTFVKAWRDSANYDKSKARLFTWLLNIARNSAIDATRTTHYKDYAKTESLNRLVQRHNHNTLNTDGMDANPLDEKYTTLIDLIYFQGYAPKEAAEATGIPLRIVKTHLRHAFLEMRASFARHGVNNSDTLL